MKLLGSARTVNERSSRALDACLANPNRETLLAYGIATYSDGFDQAVLDVADTLADLGVAQPVIDGLRLAGHYGRLQGVEP